MANRDRVLQGQSDFPLNDLGRRQARAAGKSLREQIELLDAAYTSDLSRAAETMDIILETSGAKFKDESLFKKEKLIRERKFGKAESK